MNRRPGGLALASIALIVVAVAALGFLWSTRGGPRASGQALGGPLLEPSPSAIDALLLNVGGRSFRLDLLAGGGWTLTGALVDDVDPQAMAALLEALGTAVAGPLLPGTEPGDRRYAFNGPESVQLTVHRVDDSQSNLSLGDINPVAGTRYASGAGRRFCFTVPAALRDRLASLPDGVRARVLLPGVQPEGVDRITIERENRPGQLVRQDGRWWLRAPDGAAAFGPLAAQYHAQYDDRRRTDADGLWLQASTRAVETLIYEVSDIVVRELAPPQQAAELTAAWGLSPPWRRVTLAGPAVRPALRGAAGEDQGAPALSFGPPLDGRNVPVLRHGQVLVADREATTTLEQPTAVLLDLGALPVYALAADLLEVSFEGRPLLRGSRRGDQDSPDGRVAWLTDEPAADRWSGSEADRNGLVRDLVVNLSRQPIAQALPPVTAPDPLLPRGRVGVELTYGTDGEARALKWELGYPRVPVAGVAAVLWTPETGRLVAIPEELLVSVRNAAALIAARP
jgi:hypothetical protein